jgi:hypothetical protein
VGTLQGLSASTYTNLCAQFVLIMMMIRYDGDINGDDDGGDNDDDGHW